MATELRLYTPDGTEYHPLPRQAEFHASPAKFRAYIGGFGSGKTLAGVAEDIMLGMEYPGIRTLICRKSYKELKATTQADFFRVCPEQLIESFNKVDGLCTFKNGSEFLFWNLHDEKTLRSLNLGRFHIDEASEVEEEFFRLLRGRLRQTTDRTGKQIPRGGILTSNPNGHDWIWDNFVNRQGETYYARNYQLIHAPTYENRFLPEDYILDLKNTYPEEWLARFMEGSFDVFEGQVYPMLDERHHVIGYDHAARAREYIRSLPRYRAIDHGFTNPTVCLWCAVDPDDNAFVYREYRASRKLVTENCQAIKEQSRGEEYIRTLIDPSTRNKTGAMGGLSILDEYREHDIHATPGNHEKKAGILRLSDYLRFRADRVHPITRELGAPRLFFLPGCESTYEELRMLAWKKLKPGQARHNALEEHEEKNDHGPDALRYFVMDRPIGPDRRVVAMDGYSATLSMLRALEGAAEGDDRDLPMIGQRAKSGLRAMLPNGFEISVS